MTQDCGKDCTQANEAADAAVKKVFAILGIDIDDPKQVEEFRQDLRFAGSLRQDVKDGKTTIRRVALTIFLTAISGALWIGVKSYLPPAH